MKNNTVVISDFISYAINERGIGAELVGACLDFIGEDELIELSESVASGAVEGFKYSYSPADFFEENKSIILARASNLEDLGMMMVDGHNVCIVAEKHAHFVAKNKSTLPLGDELDSYNGFAAGVTVAVLVDIAEAMYYFTQA